MTSSKTVLAIIGGSGLYNLDALENVSNQRVNTPFGDPSSEVTTGHIGDTKILFIARHGTGHTLLPQEVNYRANIYALKQLGATHLVSISAVGSLKEHIRPGDLVVVDQYIDRTKGRANTFFGDGIVAHVMFADPTCAALSNLVYECANRLSFAVHKGGTLVTMEGPAFSTRAESRLHIQMGADLIGMTAMPEAKLAREAELCYTTLALATDYDCWRENERDVTVEQIISTLNQNAAKARQMVLAIAAELVNRPRTCPCATALENAIVTNPTMIPDQTKNRLAPILRSII